MTTVQQVLNSISAYVNQDPTLPSGTDLTSQVNLIDQSQKEWADTYQWKKLQKTIAPSFGVSGTSIALPAYFKKLMSPLGDNETTPATTYIQIDPSERLYKSSTEKYVYQVGDDGTGYALVVNPPLPSAATLTLDIQVAPTALATLTDVVTCPSVQFLVLRTISKILSARSDPRFPQVKTDSDDVMASMIEEEMAHSGAEVNTTPNQFTRLGFRPGA